MSQNKRILGDLELAFTDKFEPRWNDKGSDAKDDVAFYHPIPRNGFHALGSFGLEVDGYKRGVDGKHACLVVRDVSPKRNALARPTGYERVWVDDGSGANEDGSCWRPKPPTGYVALGDVFVEGRRQPSVDDIMCVRADLVIRGNIGATIWKDRGSGADDDFGCWCVTVPERRLDDEKGAFAPNAFCGRESHNKPSSSAVAWVLCLPVTSDELGDLPAHPQLTAPSRPSDQTDPVEDRAVWVPFTAIHDPDKDLDWQVEHSPFYQIRRETFYTLQGYQYNDSSVERSDVTVSFTTGISKSKTQEFHMEVGIEVSATAGVSAFGSGGEVSTTVSTQMGWSSSTSVSEFAEQTVETSLTAAPFTAVAMWSISHRLVVYRADGRHLHSFMEFHANLEHVFDELAIPRDA